MKPCRINTLDELLKMSLSEDVFERILGMLEQERHNKMEKASNAIKTAQPKGMPGL